MVCLGNTYLCDWKKAKGEYVIFLVEHPSIKAQGKYFFDCEDAFHMAIWDKIGDNEASLMYVNGLPDEVIASKYFELPYYVLMGNYGGYLPLDEYSRYFAQGLCKVCNSSYDDRNDTQLLLGFKAQNTDIIFIEKTNIRMFSERVINALEPFNNGAYDVRQVNFSYKKRTRFYEIIWKKDALFLDSLAVNDDSIGEFSAWKCSACSARGSFYQDDRGLTFYVSKDALVENNPDIFCLNGDKLCVSDRVLTVLKNLKLKKISADPIGVVDKKDITDNPDIEIRYAKKFTKPKLPG